MRRVAAGPPESHHALLEANSLGAVGVVSPVKASPIILPKPAPQWQILVDYDRTYLNETAVPASRNGPFIRQGGHRNNVNNPRPVHGRSFGINGLFLGGTSDDCSKSKHSASVSDAPKG